MGRDSWDGWGSRGRKQVPPSTSSGQAQRRPFGFAQGRLSIRLGMTGFGVWRGERWSTEALPQRLNVVCQEVVAIETRTGDGWFLVEGGVRAMPVVLMDPGSEMAESLGGVLIETSVSPLADGGLDETLGLAVGARGVDASTDVAELKIAASVSEAMRVEARAIVGHNAADADVELGEVSDGLAKESTGGSRFFVGHHGGESDAGVVVDGHVEELPTGAASFVAGIAGEAMAGLVDAGQLLDVDVQQIAGGGMFVAHNGQGRFEHANFVQLQPSQNAAYGGPAQSGGLGDAHSGPALPPQSFHLPDLLGRRAPRRALRTGTAIAQARRALGTVASHPFGRALPAEFELGRGLLQTQPAEQHSLRKFLSTMNRKSSMMVIVHSVSSVAFVSQPSASQFLTEWTTTY